MGKSGGFRLGRLGVAAALVALGLGYAAPCAAQDVPYAELSAGYNFMRQQRLSVSSSNPTVSVNVPKGGYGDVAVNFNHAVGFVALITGNQIGSDSVVTAMGGLRFSRRGFARGPGRVIPFFQLMGGLMRTVTNATYFDRSVEIGGGANVTVTVHAGVRAEVDYIRTFYTGAALQGDNYIRFSVGMMYGFGAH